jgi:hypothetical protein
MEAQGFTVLNEEWWHFDYKDWREYGILNTPFETIKQTPRSAPMLQQLFRRKSVERIPGNPNAEDGSRAWRLAQANTACR